MVLSSVTASNSAASGLKGCVNLSYGQQSLSVALFGGHPLSYKVGGADVLYMSEDAKLDGSKAIRGGTPIVFPQFHKPDPAMPSHGFARVSEWTLTDMESGDSFAKAELTLTDSPESRAMWDHPFVLKEEVRLDESGFSLDLVMHNTGDSPFSCHGLLHNYLRVYPDIPSTGVEGFGGSSYLDALQDRAVKVEERDYIIIDKEVDAIFVGGREGSGQAGAAKGEVCIRHAKGQALTTTKISRSASLKLGPQPEERSTDIPCDAVFWNPWEAKARSLGDMEAGGHLKFVCVEPGLVTRKHEVPAGAKLTLSQVIRAD